MINRPLNSNEIAMLHKFTTEDMSFESLVREVNDWYRANSHTTLFRFHSILQEVREDYEKRYRPKQSLQYLREDE